MFVLLAAGWCVLGLAILVPDAVYSGDIGVKFVQARALAAARFESLDIPYPGAFLDSARTLFPMRPPFVMTTGGETQAIFSPASAALQAVAVAVAGMRGMILVSLAAGIVALFAAWAQAERRQEAAVLFAVGVASPLWFYAVSGWEHAPAIALSSLAFACVLRGPEGWAPFLAGLCLGAGATLRDEVLLLAPGLLLAGWMRTRTPGAVVLIVAGLLVPLGCAAGFEVLWFKRPLAAHLRHAVHLLQTALHVTDAPNPDVPVLRPLSLRERYETVVQYWLMGYGQDLWIGIYVSGLAAALAFRWWRGSSAGLLVWLAAVIGLAALDLHELVTAPKWLAGLHRVSPYLVAALFPLPRGSERRGWYVPVVLITTGAYLALAFVGAEHQRRQGARSAPAAAAAAAPRSRRSQHDLAIPVGSLGDGPLGGVRRARPDGDVRVDAPSRHDSRLRRAQPRRRGSRRRRRTVAGAYRGRGRCVHGAVAVSRCTTARCFSGRHPGARTAASARC